MFAGTAVAAGAFDCPEADPPPNISTATGSHLTADNFILIKSILPPPVWLGGCYLVTITTSGLVKRELSTAALFSTFVTWMENTFPFSTCLSLYAKKTPSTCR